MWILRLVSLGAAATLAVSTVWIVKEDVRLFRAIVAIRSARAPAIEQSTIDSDRWYDTVYGVARREETTSKGGRRELLLVLEGGADTSVQTAAAWLQALVKLQPPAQFRVAVVSGDAGVAWRPSVDALLARGIPAAILRVRDPSTYRARTGILGGPLSLLCEREGRILAAISGIPSPRGIEVGLGLLTDTGLSRLVPYIERGQAAQLGVQRQ